MDFIAESTSFGEPSTAQVKVDFLGTAPPRRSVKNVAPVSGQVTCSGILPRTSSSRRFAERALFQRMVASTESVAQPPYSRPSSSSFGQPSSHCGWINRVNSTFLVVALPSSLELFSANAFASWWVLPQCGQLKQPCPSITPKGCSSSATNSGESGAIRAVCRSTSNSFPQQAHSKLSHASTVSVLMAMTGVVMIGVRWILSRMRSWAARMSSMFIQY